jgi:1-acyl-sn-glycerol-3-phosphate acyltransferase
MSTLRASLRLLFLIGTIVLVPLSFLLVVVASLFGPAVRHRIVMAATPYVCGAYAAAFGIGLRTVGRRDPAAKIFVGNHVSYLDIFIAGAATGGVFVSRHDVKDWPVMGWFARMAGTVFIDRSSLRSAIESSHGIVERVDEGARITLFPEGGILRGEGVKAFKPFLFAAIAEEGHGVQPFAIVYTHVDGRPIDTETRRKVEWHDSNLVAHAWEILKLRGIAVTVRFGTTTTAGAEGASAARAFAEQMRGAVAELARGMKN